MTYKQIEQARETRLWIGQIIVPGIMLLGSTLAIPEVRQAIAMKAEVVKQNLKERRRPNKAFFFYSRLKIPYAGARKRCYISNLKISRGEKFEKCF